MKAITIKQPWLTLISLGEKKFETRSWQTKYRGITAIHAGKMIDKAACGQNSITQALLRHGIESYKELPTGAVIATAYLVKCHKIMEDRSFINDEERAVTDNGLFIEGDEWSFGDYSEGRYAWKLSNVNPLAKPIPAKVRLSLWEWEGIE